MILGIGLDLVGIDRIRGVHARQGQRFLDRVYAVPEQQYCLAARDPAERLAGRWAAKEACMKALGTGWAQGITFRDIAFTSDGTQPRCSLAGGAARRAQTLGVTRIHCSITHSDGMAAALVVLEGTAAATA